jgi:hypothetical protein
MHAKRLQSNNTHMSSDVHVNVCSQEAVHQAQATLAASGVQRHVGETWRALEKLSHESKEALVSCYFQPAHAKQLRRNSNSNHRNRSSMT